MDGHQDMRKILDEKGDAFYWTKEKKQNKYLKQYIHGFNMYNCNGFWYCNH